jgi:transcriptional regulator with XRE-family HTH domain
MNENRAYTFGHPMNGHPLMAKHVNKSVCDFGRQLAALRKAAGYTQQQLADEIGVSRRQIAYYESESPHPPANLLVDLAHALGVTTDELLGLKPKKTTPKLGSRLERRLRQVEQLGPRSRKQILQVLDTFIEAEQLKRKANA